MRGFAERLLWASKEETSQCDAAVGAEWTGIVGAKHGRNPQRNRQSAVSTREGIAVSKLADWRRLGRDAHAPRAGVSSCMSLPPEVDARYRGTSCAIPTASA